MDEKRLKGKLKKEGTNRLENRYITLYQQMMEYHNFGDKDLEVLETVLEILEERNTNARQTIYEKIDRRLGKKMKENDTSRINFYRMRNHYLGNILKERP
jgi:glucose-6-phosphate-specific signal transduction histidine kinase